MIASVLALPPVVTARAVLETFDRAGGGLVAGGLAYAAIFAMLPALLLITGLLGLVLGDPEREQQAVAAIGQAFPPLATVADQTLEQVARGAVPVSVVGLAGLAWGASRFYGSLDDAFARIFAKAPPRGLLERIVRGLLSVVFAVVVFLGGVVLTSVASALLETSPFGLPVGEGTRLLWRVIGPALAAAVFVLGVGLIYRLVPDRHVPIGALWLPALVVGIALALFTQLFTLLAPRLIGAAALYGSLAALFGMLVWLATGFQALLIGAAWVRVRLDPPARASAPRVVP